MKAAGPISTGKMYSPGSVRVLITLPNSTYTRQVRSSTMAYRPNRRASISAVGMPISSATNVISAAVIVAMNLSPRLEVNLSRLVIEPQPHVTQIGVENGRTGAIQLGQLRRQKLERLHLGLRLQRLDLHGA